jgi:hypothetical protein
MLDGVGGTMRESVQHSFIVNVGVNSMIGEWVALLLKKASGGSEEVESTKIAICLCS